MLYTVAYWPFEFTILSVPLEVDNINYAERYK